MRGVRQSENILQEIADQTPVRDHHLIADQLHNDQISSAAAEPGDPVER